jgi:hypothetical protein
MIEESPNTFTVARLQEIVNKDLATSDPSEEPSDPGPTWRETWLKTHGTQFAYDAAGGFHAYGASAKQRKRNALEWCQEYIEKCTDPGTPLEQLDRCHSRLVTTGFHPEQAGGISVVVERAHLLL